MDEFEKEYFEKLKPIADDFRSKRRELAKARIKMFSMTVSRQLLNENETFDLMLGSGNSGLFMTSIASLVYEILGITQPKIINLPLYRFNDLGQLHDNSDLLPSLKGKLFNLTPDTNILFVDDEIMKGLTVKATLELILHERPDLKAVRTVIIAENHFFEWHFNMPKVSINFFSYARLIQNLNGNIGHFIPEDLYNEISLLISDVQSYNQACAIVIGGALKRKDEKNNSYFDTTVEETLKKHISNYNERKSHLKIELQSLVKEAIDEYKAGSQKLRF